MSAADSALSAFAVICGVFAGSGCVYLLVSGVLVLRFRRDPDGPPAEAPPVTVLVPLCGEETGLVERLVRLRNQDYPAPVQIICGVRDATDPALDCARRAAAEEGRWPIEYGSDPRQHGRNRKISNLINMMRYARHDTIVMVDSDMEVASDHLSRVVPRLARPGVGAVTCLYQGVGQGGMPARLAAMGINLHFLPNVVVGLATGMAAPCFGATIAITRGNLERIGGLEAFVDQLWDDYAIGEAVRARGLEVSVCSFAPVHVCTEPSFRSLFANQLRVARTIRGIDPSGHAGAVLTHPFALALLSVLAAGAWWTWLLLGVAYSCRLIVARCVERRFGVARVSYTLVPARDLLSFAIYLASYGSARVEWRGETYRVDTDGSLTPTAN